MNICILYTLLVFKCSYKLVNIQMFVSALLSNSGWNSWWRNHIIKAACKLCNSLNVYKQILLFVIALLELMVIGQFSSQFQYLTYQTIYCTLSMGRRSVIEYDSDQYVWLIFNPYHKCCDWFIFKRQNCISVHLIILLRLIEVEDNMKILLNQALIFKNILDAQYPSLCNQTMYFSISN